MKMKSELTSHLFEIRTQKKMSQKELADSVGITSRSIMRWERGECCPSLYIALKLAQCLDCQVGEIFELKNEQ